MSGATTELSLATAVDSDDNADYLTLSLATSLRTVDALFNNVTGHTHNGAHQGAPVPASTIPNGSISNAQLGPDVARDNLLSNPGFEIWQRGPGAFTTTGALTADRWINASAGTDVLSVSKDTTNQDAAGSLACAAVTFTLGTGGGNSVFYQKPTSADGYQLRNRIVTFSVRIKTSTANAVRIAGYNGTAYQFSAFHSGNGSYQTISVTWTMGATAALMNVGVFFTATCVAYIDNAMLVIGAQPADYVPLHPADDLARCLRYYEVVGTAAGGDFIIRGWAGAASQAIDTNAICRVVKTVTPTVTKVGTWNVQNCAQPTANAAAVTGFRAEVIATAAAADTFALNQNAGCFFTMEANT